MKGNYKLKRMGRGKFPHPDPLPTASGLAGAAGKLGTLGLASAIFSPWMNISGSVLANYWRKRPVE
jgi:hypothetical protein